MDSATGVVFTGDALGIHVPNLPVLRPATPPPEFDLELAIASIERIRAAASSTLLFAHFGPIADVDRTCDLAVRRLREWTDAVRDAMRSTTDLDEIVEVLAREAARETVTGAEAQLDLDRLETLAGVRMNAAGIVRYLTKRAEQRCRVGRRSRPSGQLSQALRGVERARVVTHHLVELLGGLGLAARLREDVALHVPDAQGVRLGDVVARPGPPRGTPAPPRIAAGRRGRTRPR